MILDEVVPVIAASETDTSLALTALAYPELVSRITGARELLTDRGVRFGATLSAENLADFERRRGCVLPIAYRLWLEFVGNGASGSQRKWWEALLPLPFTEDEFSHCESYPVNLSLPFPLMEWWTKAGNGEPSEAICQDNHATHPYTLALREAEALLAQGCLRIQGKYDTGFFVTLSYLVVTGDEAGSVWRLTGSPNSESWAVEIEPQNDFLAWYAPCPGDEDEEE